MSKDITPEDVIQYLWESKSCFVILHPDGTYKRWKQSGGIVVYDDVKEAENDSEIGDAIISEYDYITRKVEED